MVLFDSKIKNVRKSLSRSFDWLNQINQIWRLVGRSLQLFHSIGEYFHRIRLVSQSFFLAASRVTMNTNINAVSCSYSNSNDVQSLPDTSLTKNQMVALVVFIVSRGYAIEVLHTTANHYVNKFHFIYLYFISDIVLQYKYVWWNEHHMLDWLS